MMWNKVDRGNCFDMIMSSRMMWSKMCVIVNSVQEATKEATKEE